MKNNTLILAKKQSLNLPIFGGLLAIAIIAPFFHFQPITGPIVNTTLFLGALFLGPSEAIMLGLLPSLVALSVGTLPSPLAAMVPFIMTSNALLIITFSQLKNKSFTLAVIIGSIVKYLFLLSSSYLVVHLITQEQVVAKAASIMMSYPQLITALIGGAIAYCFIFLKNGRIRS